MKFKKLLQYFMPLVIGMTSNACSKIQTPVAIKNPMEDAMEVTYNGEIPGYTSEISFYPKNVEFGDPIKLDIILRAKNNTLYPQRARALYSGRSGEGMPMRMHAVKRSASGNGEGLLELEMSYAEGEALKLALFREAFRAYKQGKFKESYVRW